MTYAEYFAKIKKKFDGTDVSDIKEHLAFQFNIADEDAGGIFYAEVKDGQLYIEPYEYFDRDAMFVSTPEVLDSIMEGKMDPVKAYLEHQVTVEGNIDKALRLKDLIEMKNKQQKKAAAAQKKAAKTAAKTAAKAKKTAAKKTAAAQKKTAAKTAKTVKSVAKAAKTAVKKTASAQKKADEKA